MEEKIAELRNGPYFSELDYDIQWWSPQRDTNALEEQSCRGGSY